MPSVPLSLPPGFLDLAPTEQVRYVQFLWEQIVSRVAKAPIPATHLDLAIARSEEHRQDPGSAEPAFAMLDRIAET